MTTKKTPKPDGKKTKRPPKPKPDVSAPIDLSPEPASPADNRRKPCDYDEAHLIRHAAWEDRPFFREVALNYFRIAKELGLLFTSVLLEIGCGRGFIVRHLRQMGFAGTHGMEYGQAALQNSICDAVHADLTKPLPSTSGCFDLVFCVNVLDSIPAACILSALREIHRIVVPGGHLMTHSATEAPDALRLSFVAAGWEERIDLESLLNDVGYNRSRGQWTAIWRKKA